MTEAPPQATTEAPAQTATEASAQAAHPSNSVSLPHAVAEPAPISEVRTEVVAPPNQAGSVVASAVPEQAAQNGDLRYQGGSVVASVVPERASQNGNPPPGGSPRAETPDPSPSGDTAQASAKTIASAVENVATRALSSALNDVTAGSHKLSQTFTADAQEQSVAAARSSAAGASQAAGLGAQQEKAAPAQTNAPVEPRNFLENVVRQTRLLTRPDGASELTLNLQPSELGSVVVRLTLKDGHLDGHLQVDNPSARESLESVLPRVKQALAGEGIDLDRLEVAVRGDGSSRQSGQDSARGWQTSQAGRGLSSGNTAIEAPVGASAAPAGRSAAAARTMDFIV